MTNAAQAFPSIQIQCQDRLRNFCLNLGGFRAMEHHLREELNDPEFSILEDFDWSSNDMDLLILMIWGGLFTDSEGDDEPLTVEKVRKIVSVFSIAELRGVVDQSLANTLTDAQRERMNEQVEKKRKEKSEKRKKGNLQVMRQLPKKKKTR